MGRYDYDDMPSRNNSRGGKGNRRTALLTAFFILVALIVLVVYLIMNPSSEGVIKEKKDGSQSFSVPVKTENEEPQALLIPLLNSQSGSVSSPSQDEESVHEKAPDEGKTEAFTSQSSDNEIISISEPLEENILLFDDSAEAAVADAVMTEENTSLTLSDTSIILSDATPSSDESAGDSTEMIEEIITTEEKTTPDEVNGVTLIEESDEIISVEAEAEFIPYETEAVIPEIEKDSEVVPISDVPLPENTEELLTVTVSDTLALVEADSPEPENSPLAEGEDTYTVIIPSEPEEVAAVVTDIPAIAVDEEEEIVSLENDSSEDMIIEVTENQTPEETTSSLVISVESAGTQTPEEAVNAVFSDEENAGEETDTAEKEYEDLSTAESEEISSADSEEKEEVHEENILSSADPEAVISNSTSYFDGENLVICGKSGSAVRALREGTVTKVGRNDGLKYVVVTDDEGISLRYSGFERVTVTLEKRVKAASVLGSIGSSSSSQIMISQVDIL